MPGLKEIKRRLRSVRNTKKITYAMKLVSAAKLRKAQEAVTLSREYADELNRLLGQLMQEQGGVSAAHPLMEERAEIKNIALLIVGGQRGLCGGYNTNINKKVEWFFRQKAENYPGAVIHPFILGKKPAEYFRRVKRSYVKAYEDLPENASVWPIEEVGRELESAFAGGSFDQVWVIFTRFKSAISQVAMVEKLLPLTADDLPSEKAQKQSVAAHEHGDAGWTLFEPSRAEVFSSMMPRVMRTKIRQACLDAKASETASRMTAMDSATKNAGQLVRKLELKHNRMRQLSITSQLIDIIGGAEAIK